MKNGEESSMNTTMKECRELLSKSLTSKYGEHCGFKDPSVLKQVGILFYRGKLPRKSKLELEKALGKELCDKVYKDYSKGLYGNAL